MFDADILERPAPAAPPDRHHRIAVAEVSICILLVFREIGMRIAAFLAPQAARSEGGPRRPMMAFRFMGDPRAAFDHVWRAVHLAAALALRIADEIAALRAGKPLGPVVTAPKAAREAKALGDELQEIALEALAQDIETAERPEGLLGEVQQLRREARMDPAFRRLLNGPLKDAVAAICADLGLKPDWSLWTEDGFPPPPGGGKDDWIAFFAPEGEILTLPTHKEPKPTQPPRHDGRRGWDKTWRPPWPPPEPDCSHVAAPRPPDRAVRPDDPGGGSRRATLLGTTIIAGAPGRLSAPSRVWAMARPQCRACGHRDPSASRSEGARIAPPQEGLADPSPLPLGHQHGVSSGSAGSPPHPRGPR